tara:strand:+ start:339 stop:608 length:270 start_codon:yes stop_codon:yes gene_type:complete
MNINDVVVSFLKFTEGSDKPNKPCQYNEADFALIEKDNEAGLIDNGTAEVIQKRLQFSGKIRDSKKGDHYLLYKEDSVLPTVTLGSIGL